MLDARSDTPTSDTPVVIFDCDGVLLVSNRLKTRLFAEAARIAGFAPADVARFTRYVAANFGTSRYRMFETLLAWDDVQVRPDVDVPALVTLYAERLYAEYVRCPTTPGMLAVLRELRGRGTRMFVVSGSDQQELRQVMSERGLRAYFEGIFGSPRSKTDNLVDVTTGLGMTTPVGHKVIFIGDAEADYKAANSVGARFIYMDHFSTAKSRMRELQIDQGFERIRDLRALPAMLAAQIETL
jgi:phosphoglycolate phosphatase-like HAD superfamily hydrolase